MALRPRRPACLGVRGWNGGHRGSGSVASRASGGPLVEELVLADGSRIATDHVVEAVGVRPATGWLAGSGTARLRGAAPPSPTSSPPAT